MKRTLLDLTQSILSSLSSDEVNSISDTTESLQVAEIIKTVYFNIVTRSGLPEHDQLFQLIASTDPTAPVIMYRPNRVTRVEWIKYFDSDVANGSDGGGHDVNVDLQDNVSPGPSAPAYKYVTILPVRQFLDVVNGFNLNETNVDTFTFTDTSTPIDSFTFNYLTDRQPQYCTIIQNYFVIFDSFDSNVDTTLQSSKSQCFGQVVPLFSMVDNFIPDLDEGQFPLLLSEAKSLAFYELKQMVHSKAEQENKRQWSTIQKNKSLADKPSYFDQLPNFGRCR